MTALITGGTGFLGSALLPNLSDVVVVSRDPARASRKLGRGRAVRWDPEAGPDSALAAAVAAARRTAA